MTEPKWPTGEDICGPEESSPDYTYARVWAVKGITAAKVAFAEWRANLLTEIQKPGPSGVQPSPVCPIEDVVMNLENRIEKLERRLKKVRRLAQEASNIAWAVDDATRPLTAPLSPEIRGMIKEATVPVSHSRLADEIRGAATKAPVQPKVVHDDDPDADELPTDTQCKVIAMRFGITYNCQLTRGHDGQHDGTSGQLRHQWTSP